MCTKHSNVFQVYSITLLKWVKLTVILIKTENDGYITNVLPSGFSVRERDKLVTLLPKVSCFTI